VKRATMVLAITILASCAARAAEVVPAPDELMIEQFAVTVDADLGEWDMARRSYLIDAGQAAEDATITALTTNPDNPFKGSADLSARVALGWDETYLYVAGDVTDDDLRGIRPGGAHNAGPAGWFCDSVMLQIHSFRKPLKTNSPFTDSPNLNVRYEVHPGARGQLIDDPGGRKLDTVDSYWKLTENSLVATRETAAGYIVEAAVPWADMEVAPQAGDVLHACFLLGDIDADEKLNQLGWNFSGDPKERPVFRLLGSVPATAILSMSSSRPQAGGKWTVRYQADARGADLTVKRLALIGPEGEVGSVEINEQAANGQSVSDVLTLDAMPGEPGGYEVRLAAEVGGDAVMLRAEPYELLAGAEPAPMIANPPGEVHHMRPDRVVHNAYEDHRRGILEHGYMNDRSGYELYMRTHVADYLEKYMDIYIEQKASHIAGNVIKAYALYELTGHPQYADWVRRGLEVAIGNQKTTIDRDKMLPLCEARYLIWQHDPGTDLAPAGIEQDFQEIWARIATEHDEGWMFGEWGYHNRCWHRFGVMQIAKFFAEQLGKPVSPRINEYIDWHQPKYDQFGYCTDNSAGYHWVGFRYPVWWNMAFDSLDKVAKHPEWVDALGRWRRYAAPSGAVPNFGDTSGWTAGSGSAMAYYELMGRLTGDGRFRWQAHRIAEYMYNHFSPRHDQYHGPRDFTADGFCRAWLYADDSVAPVPAEQNSEVTFRTRVVSETAEDKAARPGWSGAKMVDEKVPDKLILTSGNDPQKLWAMVELMDKGGHCGVLPGNIVTMMVHDTALLAGQGYYERSQDFNNTMWVEDMEGLAADPRPMRTEVPRFVEDGAVTYARVRADRYSQLPITYVRDIVFVKNGFMLVKDSLTFNADMKVRVGPCWQTRDLGPQAGENWFNAYYEWIYFTGLGLGKGVHSFRNPAWDLLVKYAPREDTRFTVLDRYEDNPYRTSGTQLRQSWTGIAQAGETKTFTTILLPHGPDFDVTGYADWARFVVDDDNTTLVNVTVENDNMHHLQEKHWVLLQDTPGDVAAEGFASNAQLAVVTIDRDGTLKPAVMVDGSVLTLDGRDLAAEARQPAVQSIFEVTE